MSDTPGPLASAIHHALRLAFFRRVAPEDLAASWSGLFALALLALCVPSAYALSMLGGEGRLDLLGLPEASFVITALLASCVVLAALLGRDEAVPRLLAAALLAWLAIDVLCLGAWALLEAMGAVSSDGLAGMAYAWFALLWLALALARHAAGGVGASRVRRLAAVFVPVALFTLPMGILAPERSLWVQDWSRTSPEEQARRSLRLAPAHEDAIHRQPELMARALAAVEPGRAGVVDVFFIGLAGYGEQDVFMREVDAVAGLMRERFDAAGRTIRLVNNPKTVLTAPIASVTHLDAALRRVAAGMDVEEDVLVLFLTSHGSADHRFSLSLWPIQFRELDPPALRRALDESGIRNRVVIVSSCYSGGFVEALRGERTLVIAASAPDRNSFGCSNEAEWTYFGKAFFDEELRRTHSFVTAFERAVPSIAAREKAENFDASRPMMALGEAMRLKLGQLEAQLERRLAVAGPRAAAR